MRYALLALLLACLAAPAVAGKHTDPQKAAETQRKIDAAEAVKSSGHCDSACQAQQDNKIKSLQSKLNKFN